MYHKRSTLFFTELLLLFLISQLFWPIAWYISSPVVVQFVNILLIVASSLCLLVLPGRWWSYLFFADEHIGSTERCIISLAISLALVVFSSAYLQWGGVALYPGTILTFLVFWLFFGILVAFSRSARNENADVAEEYR